MNEALKKNEKYRKKYMRSHKMLTFVLDKQKDADIIEWLDNLKNRSETVRTLLRDAATKN